MSHKKILAAASVALVLLLSACGGSSSDGDAEGGDLTKITAGIIPISNLTPFYVAQQKGFFADRGLEVESSTATGGAALTSALTGGSLQFAYSNLLSPLSAELAGIDLTIVAGQNAAQVEGNDSAALVVAKDSEIQSVSDLAGRKVAVNALNNSNQVASDYLLEQHGVDPSSVTYVELAFPDMVNALQHGDIAAANLVEPFVKLAGDGLRVLAYPFTEFRPGLDIAGWITSSDYAEEHPEVVENFVAALAEANDFLNENQDEKIKWTAEFTKSDPELIGSLVLDRWVSTVDPESYQDFVDTAVKYGALSESVDVTTMLAPTAVAK